MPEPIVDPTLQRAAQEAQEAEAMQGLPPGSVLISNTQAVDPTGQIYYPGTGGGWTGTGQFVPQAVYDRIFGQAQGEVPETIPVTSTGRLQWNPDTGQWEQVPGSAAPSGGAAGPTGTWQWNRDLGVYVNNASGAVMTPEQMGIEFEGGGAANLLPPASLMWQWNQNPDGSWYRYVPDETYGYRVETDPGESGGQPIVVGNRIYSYDSTTGQVTLAAELPPDPLEQQRLALQAAQSGFPNVGFNFQGTQYQQVPPSEQILAGEQPQVAFRERPVGAEPGTPFEPTEPVTVEPQPSEPGPPHRMTTERALGIAQAVAQGGGPAPMVGMAGLDVMGGLFQPTYTPGQTVGRFGSRRVAGVARVRGTRAGDVGRAVEEERAKREAAAAERRKRPRLAGGPVTVGRSRDLRKEEGEEGEESLEEKRKKYQKAFSRKGKA